jgi:outer membrane receptor protein involved in Fe transport
MAGSAQATVSDSQGRFLFAGLPDGQGTVSVRAAGFAPVERKWDAAGRESLTIEVVLQPAGIADQMTVTATRTEASVSQTAVSVTVLSARELSTTAALTIDDALRQAPGFSLFRRSGSRTANPTSQGVSLRSVGASGASRALVLSDGIPLNDPFGGWVYWGRVPRESISQVEIARGGASHLYGTDALGGVINFIPRRETASIFSLDASYGNQQSPNGSLFTAITGSKWGAQIAAQAFNTDGYILVDPDERGRVDSRAGVQYSTAELTLERRLAGSGRLFVRSSIFGESRENGTPLQTNRTHIRHLAFGGDWQSARMGSALFRVYGGPQVFDQDFSAIALDRNSETLTRSQRAPAQQTGMTAQWSRAAGSAQTVVLGMDAREVRGSTNELVFVGGNLSSAIGAGGRERTVGFFAEDIIRITPRFLATVAARIDRWRHYDALSTTTPLAQPGPASVTQFPERTETAFSPRLSLLYRVSENVSITASGYRAFRAPSLNELYRSFRVGAVLTLANDRLLAERLTGGEVGGGFSSFSRRINVNGTFFWSEITRPVANVTLQVTPALITRQRQNLGRTRSRGVDISAAARINDLFTISGGYQFADAAVLSFPANVLLEGLRLPQAPRHQLTFQAHYYDRSKVMIGVQGRFIGEQFDDDQNLLSLERYFTLDAIASKPVGRGVELYAAFENLLNDTYSIGRTPVRTTGPPLLARFGFRLNIGSR